jgi:uncharacterized membrane protein (DUF4010 family)
MHGFTRSVLLAVVAVVLISNPVASRVLQQTEALAQAIAKSDGGNSEASAQAFASASGNNAQAAAQAFASASSTSECSYGCRSAEHAPGS